MVIGRVQSNGVFERRFVPPGSFFFLFNRVERLNKIYCTLSLFIFKLIFLSSGRRERFNDAARENSNLY